MKPMFEESVVPYLEGRTDSLFVSKNVNIIGMGESRVETEIIDIMKNSLNPTVAPYAMDGEVRLRVTAKAKTREEGEKICLDMIETLRKTAIGGYVYGVDTTPEEALIKGLTERGMKIAVAESCTGGMVTGKLTSVSGASEVLDGSVVSYANEIKARLLNVSEDVLASDGAVSERCALQMADGVRCLMNAHMGLSITGIAGPGGGTPEKPVGTVYIAVSTEKGSVCERLSIRNNGREYVRNVSAKSVLMLALKTLREY